MAAGGEADEAAGADLFRGVEAAVVCFVSVVGGADDERGDVDRLEGAARQRGRHPAVVPDAVRPPADRQQRLQDLVHHAALVVRRVAVDVHRRAEDRAQQRRAGELHRRPEEKVGGGDGVQHRLEERRRRLARCALRLRLAVATLALVAVAGRSLLTSIEVAFTDMSTGLLVSGLNCTAIAGR